jgi:hypothetical protein
LIFIFFLRKRDKRVSNILVNVFSESDITDSTLKSKENDFVDVIGIYLVSLQNLSIMIVEVTLKSYSRKDDMPSTMCFYLTPRIQISSLIFFKDTEYSKIYNKYGKKSEILNPIL